MTNESKPVEVIVRKRKADSEEEVQQNGESAGTPTDESGANGESKPAVEAKPTPLPTKRVIDMAKPSVPKKTQPTFEPTTVENASFEDFEAMLNASGAAPATQKVSMGDTIEGRIESIGEKWLYVSFDGREGLAAVSDFTEDGVLQFAVGDTATFFCVAVKDHTVFLGSKLSTKEGTLDAIETAYSTGLPLDGRVHGRNKGGFEVDINGVQCFCPLSQIELNFCEDPDVHLNKNYQFKVTEFAEGGRKIVLSRSQLLKVAAEAAAERILSELKVGDVVTGRVARLETFGAFVDLGGIEGLAHISELAFKRLDHPSEAVQVDQNIKVAILSIEQGERGLRIGLSMKDTMEDPWSTATGGEIQEGAKVSGTITRLEPFGAFVEIAQGVEGLIHISELGWDNRVRHPKDVVSVGQVVAVEVISVDLGRKRIGLSMKSAQSDPWSAIGEKYTIGMELTGTVEKIEDFGVFVSIAPGVTALLPRSEMDLDKGASAHQKYRVGSETTARVLSIEPIRRRMALTTKVIEEQGPSSYSDSDAGGSGFGTFGDLFKTKNKD